MIATGKPETTAVSPVTDAIGIAQAQTMLDLVGADLDLTSGDIVMLPMDLPTAPPQNPPVMIAQVAPANAAASRLRTAGICFLAPNQPHMYSLENVLDPKVDARNYLLQFDHRDIPEDTPATITLLETAKHGVLRKVTEADRGVLFYSGSGPVDPTEPGYAYLPESGYLGKDKAVFLVQIADIKVKVIYFLRGVDTRSPGEQSMAIYCKRGYLWRISTTADPSGRLIVGAVQADPAAPVAVASMSMLAASAAIPIYDSGLITLAMGLLPGSALGQTTNTTITLDDNAAGHGWYIDYTPYLNEEYQPTSKPYEWVAKPGSEAEGKMDMLSVLLHEYGHVLGIEHSADPHDFMATTLQPGVRRLPSADELALMARLVGEIKGGMETPAPADPFAPDNAPAAPLPGRGGVRTTRARISRFGTTILSADGSEVPQYAVAANPTLTDAKLETGAGWETTGSVAIGNGAAVLSEASRGQTRLNQVFIVGPHDRYLSFTVNAVGLDNANGPDDAFEAALLDANSGASLLATTGLTKNDAFLNLQANGGERTGQAVTSTRNADGSRTYRVDLSGIAAGTAVNLSFDLIGFGPAASRVTIRDLRLGVPETRDDAAATQEDTPIDIAALANDLGVDMSAGQPGFAPAIVSGPAHGQVTVNAGGSFRYTPEANWNGEDSFTYKLSDGTVDSNLAKVSLSVSAVNDAPVLNPIAATLLEDGSVTLALNERNVPDLPGISAAPRCWSCRRERRGRC